MLKQFAEKPGCVASGAKALSEKKGLIAALKALRHPKSNLFHKHLEPLML